MRIDPDEYRLLAGKEVKLGKWPSRTKPVYASKEDYEALLREHIDRLSALQQVLYASNTRALLIIFQGMDGAGKDGAIRHVMSGVNPQGCEVHSFKQPSAEEVQHDFLWRTHLRTPARGRIGIFNRSHYEEVLIVRVHPEFLVNEGFDPKAAGHKKFWKDQVRGDCRFRAASRPQWYERHQVLPASFQGGAAAAVSGAHRAA